MNFIFDLDYTLFDADALKTGLAETLGMSREDWLKSYQADFTAKGINYNLDEHLRLLGKANDAAIRKKLTVFFHGFDRYLYNGAAELLKQLKSGNKLTMLSYGDKEWQKLKLENLTIKKYFDDIYYVDRDKSELAELFQHNGGKTAIVNDNAKEGLEMKKQLLNSQLFLVNGPYAHNVEHEQKIYDLEQLRDEFCAECKEYKRELSRHRSLQSPNGRL